MSPVTERVATPGLMMAGYNTYSPDGRKERLNMKVNYYPINEAAAKLSKEMSSFSDYITGSATANYHSMVDNAAAQVEAAKKNVEPEYHGKMDAMFDRYAKKLADYINRDNEIGTRCPSVMIAGASNFPVRKKEKQIAAWRRNAEYYEMLQKYLQKILSIGSGGISSDDARAVEKLEVKLKNLQQQQELMKSVNAYYRKHKTLEGCPGISAETAERIKSSISNGYNRNIPPFEAWQLSNNNANIRRIKSRIEQLKAISAMNSDGWTFNGGRVELNKNANRIQLFYDEKPDADTRANLKSHGFRWAPSYGAWQRMLNENGIYAAKEVTKN